MGLLTGIAIYLTIWWTALFTILPLGNRTYAEEGLDVPGGGEKGAPIKPNLKKKFITTTWVSAVLWLILFAVIKLKLISLPPLPGAWQ